MGKLLENLKKYFKETPKEQLDKDFKEIYNTKTKKDIHFVVIFIFQN